MENEKLCLEMLCNGHINSFFKFFPLHDNIKNPKLFQHLLEEYETATRLTNEFTIITSATNLADFYSHELGDYKNSIQYLQIAVSYSGKDIELEIRSVIRLGNEYLKANKNSLALECFMKSKELAALHKGVDGDIQSLILSTLLKLGLEAQDNFISLDYYLKALDYAKSPNDIGSVHFQLGNINYKIGRKDIALESFEKFLDLNEQDGSDCIEAKIRLAECYEFKGNREFAIGLLETIGNIKHQTIVNSKLSDLYIKAGREEEGVKLLSLNYKMIQNSGNQRELDQAAYELGIAEGNLKMKNYLQMVFSTNINTLLQWKTSRVI